MRYYNQEIINSEYQFSTLFAWQHVYEFMYEVWDDCLLVFGKQTNGILRNWSAFTRAWVHATSWRWVIIMIISTTGTRLIRNGIR